MLDRLIDWWGASLGRPAGRLLAYGVGAVLVCGVLLAAPYALQRVAPSSVNWGELSEIAIEVTRGR
ncbi:hypothetical protein [Streptomyces sp. H27-C3]|uniref:hypothetical protein n=1 Tax=Streptomyces sp. H27-C3 TaxID=3046305 RepID=UPI0024B96E48|nr:hypothetical protein [Streptomyces sp. H27-C3]MDJ0466958.1 hypothetical protein [Streptomyces sp. H27-C3]